jgi:hypothetical protein
LYRKAHTVQVTVSDKIMLLSVKTKDISGRVLSLQPLAMFWQHRAADLTQRPGFNKNDIFLIQDNALPDKEHRL